MILLNVHYLKTVPPSNTPFPFHAINHIWLHVFLLFFFFDLASPFSLRIFFTFFKFYVYQTIEFSHQHYLSATAIDQMTTRFINIPEFSQIIFPFSCGNHLGTVCKIKINMTQFTPTEIRKRRALLLGIRSESSSRQQAIFKFVMMYKSTTEEALTYLHVDYICFLLLFLLKIHYHLPQNTWWT